MNQNTEFFEMGEQRPVFGTSSPPSGGLPSAPQSAPTTAPTVTPDTKLDLQAFEQEVNQRAANILGSGPNYLSWAEHKWGVDSASDETLSASMHQAFSGLSPESKRTAHIFIDKLKSNDKEAQEILSRLVAILSKQAETVKKTTEQLGEITDIPIAKEAGDCLKNVVDAYHRQVGAGKVVLLAAALMIVKLLFDKDFRAKESPFGCTWGELMQYAGFGVGINYLIGAVRDDRKTGMDLLGLNNPEEDLPAMTRTLAALAGIKDPEQFPALTAAGRFNRDQMTEWFYAYKSGQASGGAIPPGAPPFGQFKLSEASALQRRKDLYNVMHEMIKMHNGGNVTAGMEEKFYAEYLDPKNPRTANFTFPMILADLISQNRTPVPTEIAGEAATREHIDRVLGFFKSPALKEFKVVPHGTTQLLLNTVPVIFVPIGGAKPDEFSYNIITPDKKIVRIDIDNQSGLAAAIDTLKANLGADIRRRVKTHPEFDGKTPYWNKSKGRWIFKDVKIGATLHPEVYVEGHPGNNDSFILYIGEARIEGTTGSLEVLHQNAIVARQVEMYNDGVFEGLRVHVESTAPAGTNIVKMEGTIAGATFKAELNKTTGRFDKFEFNYDDTSFTESKADLMARNGDLNKSFRNLSDLADNANEEWVPIKAWNTVNEDYWKGLVKFKQYEALSVYKTLLSSVRTPEDIAKADAMLKGFPAKVDALYQDIHSQIADDKEISDTDFQGWISGLEGLKLGNGSEYYANQGYKEFMFEMRTYLQDKDFEGDDYKVFMLVYKEVSDATVGFSRIKGDLNSDQKGYLSYVMDEVRDLLTKSGNDKAKFWQGVGTIFDMIPGVISWALDHKRGVGEVWGSLYENVDDNVKARDVRRFLNLKSYESWYSENNNGKTPPPLKMLGTGETVPEIERTADGKERMNRWAVYNHIRERYNAVSIAIRGIPKADRKSTLYTEMVGVMRKTVSDTDRISALGSVAQQKSALKQYSQDLIKLAQDHLNTPKAQTDLLNAIPPHLK